MTIRLRKPLNQYKAIFFDVGDTLMTIPESKAIMQRYLSSLGLQRDQQRIGELFEEAFRQFYYGKEHGPATVCTPESDRAFWVELYRYILIKLDAVGESWSEERIREASRGMYELFTSPEPYALFDDVAEAVEALAGRGFRLGIVSNFAPTLKSILEHKGILHQFQPVVVSTEVGLEKPDPAIFRLALEQSGHAADEVLYVGDHELNDIWAPAQAGIDAVKIKRYAYHTGDGIHSLWELLTL